MENLELDELVYTYPVYNIAGIQTLISAKEEFVLSRGKRPDARKWISLMHPGFDR